MIIAIVILSPIVVGLISYFEYRLHRVTKQNFPKVKLAEETPSLLPSFIRGKFCAVCGREILPSEDRKMVDLSIPLDGKALPATIHICGDHA
jgi:hypothetical protein